MVVINRGDPAMGVLALTLPPTTWPSSGQSVVCGMFPMALFLSSLAQSRKSELPSVPLRCTTHTEQRPRSIGSWISIRPAGTVQQLCCLLASLFGVGFITLWSAKTPSVLGGKGALCASISCRTWLRGERLLRCCRRVRRRMCFDLRLRSAIDICVATAQRISSSLERCKKRKQQIDGPHDEKVLEEGCSDCEM